MGKITGFLEIERAERPAEKPEARINNYKEFVHNLPAPEVSKQAARCMDCGIPFCHNGCPVNNLIPDWNNLVYRDQWRTASESLHSTNNFPEFTGRICPAPCEASCTLNIIETPSFIRHLIPFAAYYHPAKFDPTPVGTYIVTPPSSPEMMRPIASRPT